MKPNLDEIEARNKKGLLYATKLAWDNYEVLMEAAQQASVEGEEAEDRRCCGLANNFLRIYNELAPLTQDSTALLAYCRELEAGHSEQRAMVYRAIENKLREDWGEASGLPEQVRTIKEGLEASWSPIHD